MKLTSTLYFSRHFHPHLTLAFETRAYTSFGLPLKLLQWYAVNGEKIDKIEGEGKENEEWYKVITAPGAAVDDKTAGIRLKWRVKSGKIFASDALNSKCANQRRLCILKKTYTGCLPTWENVTS